MFIGRVGVASSRGCNDDLCVRIPFAFVEFWLSGISMTTCAMSLVHEFGGYLVMVNDNLFLSIFLWSLVGFAVLIFLICYCYTKNNSVGTT